jgi:hypothetical protein
MTQTRQSGRAWLADEDPRDQRMSRVRVIIAVVLAVMALCSLVLFVLGAWNPWRLVVLVVYFGNPMAGAFVVSLLVFLSVWLLTPVVNEAAQNRRLWLRFGLGALVLVTLGVYGVGGSVFGGDYETLAESADGSRRLVMRTHGEDRELRIWAGTGLRASDRGWLGLACGNVVGSFSGNDQVHVASVYGEFDLRLDPDTGDPIDTIGPTCSG